jgi:hypothetical protein
MTVTIVAPNAAGGITPRFLELKRMVPAMRREHPLMRDAVDMLAKAPSYDGPRSSGTPQRIARWRTRRAGPSVDRLGAGRALAPAPARRTREATMEGKKAADERDLERQLWAATEVIREAVLRLLQAGEIYPPVIVLAAARVAGEMGADAALEGGEDVENLLDELAEVMRQAGLEHHATLQGEGLLVTGNA